MLCPFTVKCLKIQDPKTYFELTCKYKWVTWIWIPEFLKLKLLYEIFRKLDISYRIWRHSSKNIFHGIFQNFKKTLRVSKTTKYVLHPLGISSKLLEDSSYLNWKCHVTNLLLQVTYLAPHVCPYCQHGCWPCSTQFKTRRCHYVSWASVTQRLKLYQYTATTT